MISKRYDHLLRLLLVGETGVGKTCLLCRYASDDFVSSHISTIGQERFEAITKQFYRRAQGILLVFDISSRKSYESVPRWLQLVNEFADQHNINFYEVSAKNRNNVDKPFQDMCRSILQQEDQSPEQENTSITIDTNTPAASSQGSGEQDPALGPGVTGEGEGSQQGNWCCSIS
ncbi:RAB13-like protein [Mya arenaria]|uniref:RAB13-like protein n=1 Tax=Mya arenaria TaxID=6604 RepID=A0ABY7FCF3_MYAAR|nr:RAB13-like protein [Mya arenaria]